MQKVTTLLIFCLVYLCGIGTQAQTTTSLPLTSTIDIGGITTYESQGNAGNTILSPPMNAFLGNMCNNPVLTATGIEFNVSQTAYGASFLSEMRINFDFDQSNASEYTLQTSTTQAGGTETNSSGGINPIGPFVIANATTGNIDLEFYESFVDVANPNGMFNAGSEVIVEYTLTCDIPSFAPTDTCENTGVQTGLGGVAPTGGIYSGVGVTDDGNGMTYSFDPSVAGPGTHTITYRNGSTSIDAVKVFALPTVMFTALADICIDAGTQTGLGGGTPIGGVYSGPGVTDDGNGMTYSFNPATAGVGTHTLTYTYTDANGCTAFASDDVEVFELPTVMFTALADICIDAGTQTGLGGGTPIGGVYSGPGVTDDGNGMTYSFNPATAGVGTHTLTYTYTDANGCTAFASDDVEVFELPTVMFTALADICIDAGTQTGLGGGTPIGGVYSGPGVTDDGNGMTYSFNPATAGVGTHTLTYTYTDANGCTAFASDDVEVFELPTVMFTALADICIDAGTQTGLGGGTPIGGVYSGPGVTDDGNGMTYSFNPATAGVGTHTLTYTYTDANGCTAFASDDVEVFELPTVMFTALADICIDAGTQTGLGGGTPIGGVYSGPGVTDNGNGMTYSFNPATAGVGTHTLTYTYTDANGCTAFASDDVEVFELPTVMFTALADICIDAGTQTGLGGGTPIGGVYSGPGVTDDGNGMTYSFNPATAGVGTHTLTYTYTDANGCTAFASDDVEVFELPTVMFTALADICIDAGIQTGLGGGTPIGGVYSGPGVTDDGNGMTYSFNPATAGVGTHTLTYTYTDANGCTAFASDDVEVFELPTVMFTALADICIDAGTQTGLGGGTPIGGVYSGPGVTDDGNGMTYSFNPATAGVGTHTLTYTYTDANGCTAFASDDVEVFELPTVMFTALADICIDAGTQTGLGGGTPIGGVYSGPGVTDDGNGMTYSFNPATAGVGTHTLTYTYTDANGCTAFASDDVEVFELPTVMFTALADICIDAGTQTGLGGGTPIGGVYSGPGVTDDGNGMTYSFNPATAGVGTHTLTYTYTDANGCTAFASDDVEVFELPTVMFTALADICIDAGTQTGLGGGTPIGGVYSGPGVTDDGNGMTYSFNPATAGVGTHTLTYTYTDANGCTAFASDDVEVFELPTVMFTALADICIDAGTQTGLGGGTPIGGVYSGPGVTDDGNGMTYSFNPATAGVGTHTLTYTYTDANGCTAFASDDVEVFELPTVMFTALADICIDAGTQTGLGGGTPIGGVYSGPGVTDDGNGMTYSFNPATAGVGTHTLTYTYTDANGCTAFASDDVEVFELPIVMFTAPESPVCFGAVLTGQGEGTPIGGVYSGPGVTDDGNGMTYTFDAGAAGNGTSTLTYTYTNMNGCTNSASDDVTVEATIPLIINCVTDTLRSTDMDNCTYTTQGTEFDATITGNCNSFMITNDYNNTDSLAGETLLLGDTIVTWTADDGNGQMVTCTITITVEDNTDPVAVCIDATVTLDNTGNATITAAAVNGGSTDNCSISSSTIDITSFTCADIGPNTVILTITDINGNTDTCEAIVTVVDTTVPVAVCQDITVELGPDGTVTIDGSLMDDGSSDSCGAGTLTFTTDPAVLSCSDIGQNFVDLIVTDESGNSSTCTAIVTVEDNLDPVLVCQDTTIELGPDGTATVDPMALLDMTNPLDNCGIDVLSVDVTEVNCNDVGGTIAITVFATDNAGNFSSCVATVTVVDTSGPVFDQASLPQGPLTRLIDPATGFYRLEDFRVGVSSTDNCSEGLLPISVIQTPFAGTPLTEGTYDITITAVDDAGNASDYVFVLIVEPALGVGDNEITLLTLTMYPNPTLDKVILSNPQNIQLRDIQVYDLTGRLVQKVDLSETLSETVIDVSTLQSATYMFVISTEKASITKQIIKE